MNSACVVIPVYKETSSPSEAASLKRCAEVLGRHHIQLAAPRGLDTSSYERLLEGRLERIVSFEEGYFGNIAGYNRLLLSDGFYREFSAWEFLLIYQLDAWVFADRLEEFCARPYDYWGAPWLGGRLIHPVSYRWVKYIQPLFPWTNRPVRFEVGNGGFSLRRIEAHRRLLRDSQRILKLWAYNEDAFFASRAGEGLKVPPLELALEFAFEKEPARAWGLSGNRLPFGCHAWEKYEPEFYRKWIEMT